MLRQRAIRSHADKALQHAEAVAAGKKPPRMASWAKWSADDAREFMLEMITYYSEGDCEGMLLDRYQITTRVARSKRDAARAGPKRLYSEAPNASEVAFNSLPEWSKSQLTVLENSTPADKFGEFRRRSEKEHEALLASVRVAAGGTLFATRSA